MLSDSVREREGVVADDDFSDCLGNVFAFCGFGAFGGGGGLCVLSDSVREREGVVADDDFSGCLGNVLAFCGFGGVGGGGGLCVLSDSVCEREGVVADDDFSTLCDSEGMRDLDTVGGLGFIVGFSGTGGGVLTFGPCPVC